MLTCCVDVFSRIEMFLFTCTVRLKDNITYSSDLSKPVYIWSFIAQQLWLKGICANSIPKWKVSFVWIRTISYFTLLELNTYAQLIHDLHIVSFTPQHDGNPMVASHSQAMFRTRRMSHSGWFTQTFNIHKTLEIH